MCLLPNAGHLKKLSDAFGALEPIANATKHHALRKAEPLPAGHAANRHPAPALDCGIAIATQIRRTIGDGGPDTLATIQEAMTVYRAYLGISADPARKTDPGRAAVAYSNPTSSSGRPRKASAVEPSTMPATSSGALS